MAKAAIEIGAAAEGPFPTWIVFVICLGMFGCAFNMSVRSSTGSRSRPDRLSCHTKVIRILVIVFLVIIFFEFLKRGVRFSEKVTNI